MSRRPIPAAFAALTVITLLGVLTTWMNDAAAAQAPQESREPPRRVVRGGPDEGPPLAPPPITASMTKDELSRALEGYLAPLVAKDEFAGVVLIAKDGQPVYQGAYGLADRERRTPMATTTRFNYASIGKSFTRTAIAQLIGQNKLALTDTLGKLLPDYPNEQTRAATVEQLLTHRAGIADFFGPAFDAAPKTQFASNADYFRFVSNQPPLFARGAREQYLREQRLLDAKMTGWYFNSPPPPSGRMTSFNGGIGGGAPGINTLLESAGPWTIIVVSNLDPPSAMRVGAAIAKALTE